MHWAAAAVSEFAYMDLITSSRKFRCFMTSFVLQVTLAAFILDSSATIAAVNQSCQASCTSLFSVEFVESKLACNNSALSCPCQFWVLDMKACAAPEVQGGHVFDVTVLDSVNLSTSSSKCTQACKNDVHLQGSCSIKGMSDLGFQISSEEKVLAALGVTFESISAYQLVSCAQ